MLALLAASVLVAGCVQADDEGSTEAGDGPAIQPLALDAVPALLATLETPVVPDAERCLSDLEAFVALAPRRYENQFQHADARDWLEQQFLDAGLQVVRHDFDGTSQAAGLSGVLSDSVPGQNILGILPGRTERLLVFGAHYDSAISAYGAAYDDGSGTVMLVELARAMAQYDWEHTLVFAEFDQEEAGLVGSAAYAQQLVEEGKQVDLMLNFDMAGINWPARFGGAVDVPVKVDFGLAGANANAALWALAVEHLGQPASSSAVTGNENATGGSSDHASFLAADLPAAWVRGAVIGNYPAYHTGDQVEVMVADVGGDRADLVAGFDTVLQRTFVFTFAFDRVAV